MPALRLQALSGNIYTPRMGWSDRASAGVSALRDASDDVGEADWGLRAFQPNRRSRPSWSPGTRRRVSVMRKPYNVHATPPHRRKLNGQHDLRPVIWCVLCRWQRGAACYAGTT